MITLRVLIPGGRVRSFRAEWDREQVPVGWRVLVPLKSGTATGVVVGVGGEEAQQEILSFPDSKPILDVKSLSLLDELSSDYLLSRGYLLQRLLPSAFFWREEEVIKVARTNLKGLDPKSLEIVEYVKKRRGVKPENLKKRFNPRLIDFLLKRGILRSEKVWNAPSLEERFYSLALPLGDALKKVRSEEKKRLLVFLSGREGVSEEELRGWGFGRSLLRELLKRGILKEESRYPEKIHEGAEISREVVRRISADRRLLWSSFVDVLREVEELCLDHISRGMSVLILFPDTAQMYRALDRLRGVLKDRLLEIHSGVPPKKLFESWFSATEGGKVIVGTFLASLCPVERLGSLILFDESSPGVKLRHAGGVDLRRVAYILSKKRGSKLLFTTPAPSLSSYLLFKEGKFSLERKFSLPRVELFKREAGEILTENALRVLEKEKEKKILLLVPKHGYSYLYCPRCEALVECPRCGTFLTYSLRKKLIYCTNCSYRQEELICPECEGPLEELGFGIERALEVVEGSVGLREGLIFSTHPRWEESYDLSIILSADSLLSVPSYRAREELFLFLLRTSLITKERLIIQTMFPEEESFRCLAEGKLEEFYRLELERREREMLPPFWRLLLLKVSDREIEGYVRKFLSPHLRSTYNRREGCYELLVKFRDRRTLLKVRQLTRRFGKAIIEAKVDPF